jgi:hypothetical protein
MKIAFNCKHFYNEREVTKNSQFHCKNYMY